MILNRLAAAARSDWGPSTGAIAMTIVIAQGATAERASNRGIASAAVARTATMGTEWLGARRLRRASSVSS